MSRINTPLLAVSVAIGVGIHELGERRAFPDDWPSPLDMNEHASHLAPGVLLGVGIAYTASRLGNSYRRARGIGIGVTATIGALFETGFIDGFYRNTTHSPADAAWTAFAGVVGAYCLRPDDPTK
jgi:hypothetical protein